MVKVGCCVMTDEAIGIDEVLITNAGVFAFKFSAFFLNSAS